MRPCQLASVLGFSFGIRARSWTHSCCVGCPSCETHREHPKRICSVFVHLPGQIPGQRLLPSAPQRPRAYLRLMRAGCSPQSLRTGAATSTSTSPTSRSTSRCANGTPLPPPPPPPPLPPPSATTNYNNNTADHDHHHHHRYHRRRHSRCRHHHRRHSRHSRHHRRRHSRHSRHHHRRHRRRPPQRYDAS